MDYFYTNNGKSASTFGDTSLLGLFKKGAYKAIRVLGVLITIPSMIIGWIISRFLIADFLYDILITYCTIEKTGLAAFSPHFFLAASCVAVVTCGSMAISCRKSLESTLATLMRQSHLHKGIGYCWKRFPYFGAG